MAGERLVKLMQETAKGMNPETGKTDIVRGIVINTEPLKIMVEKGFELDEAFLLLSPFCIEKKIVNGDVVQIPHTHTIASQTANEAVVNFQAILLWRGLEQNDRVLMLRVANGNLYYVLQREEGV